MNKILSIILFTILHALTTACGKSNLNQTNQTEPVETKPIKTEPTKTEPTTNSFMQTEGYVTYKDATQILVIAPPSNTSSQTNSQAAYFSNIPDTIEIGDRVIISYNLMRESYPGQAKAEEVKVQKSHKPKGANLTEAEALKLALSNSTIKTPILTSIDYLNQQDKWRIKVNQEEIIVADK